MDGAYVYKKLHYRIDLWTFCVVSRSFYYNTIIGLGGGLEKHCFFKAFEGDLGSTFLLGLDNDISS